MARQPERAHYPECADRIRLRCLVRGGMSCHEIAAEIQACCGHHPLKCHRLAHGWSSAEKAVRAVHELCHRQQLGKWGLTKRSWLDWESGRRPSADYLDLLCRLFETGPVELGFGTDYTPASTRSVEGTAPRRERELIMSAAHESSDHAAAAEAAGVGPNALEQLADDIVRRARSYVHAPPFPLFGELARVRDRVYWLLDRTIRPAQRHDLYLFAGQTCGLLASASFDLGYPSAAADQARAARAYGDVIGHPELRAWADGMLACIEFWEGRPAQALRLVERGLADAPSGTPRVRLLSIAARAAALLGDSDRTREAVERADRAREDGAAVHELHDEIGGEFGFDQARQAFCCGTAYLALGSGAEATAQCERALRLYSQGSAERRWYAAEASASVDLASARLLSADAEGAAEALEPVFGLQPDKRVESLVKRLGQVRLALTATGSRGAYELAERIEEFTANTITRALPPGR